jgi:hypothetical protein
MAWIEKMQDQMQDRMKVVVEVVGPALNLQMSGSISELAEFPELNFEGISDLSIDFGQVTYINSAGVRRWVKWMWAIEKERAELNFYIHRCSTRIIRQILAVSSFVPKKTVVKSFFAPYFCEKDSETLVKLFVVESWFQNEIQSLSKKLHELVKCPKCGQPMEFDALVEDYFKLIQIPT